jgi:hypothetical protein
VPRVPAGHYRAEVTVRGAGPTTPAEGDLHGQRVGSFATADGPMQVSVPLLDVMRLTAPRTADDGVVSSPVAISWQPVRGAASYEAFLVPDDDLAYRVEDDLHAVVDGPRWDVRVPPGAWGIEITAMGSGDEVLGQLSRRRVFVVGPSGGRDDTGLAGPSREDVAEVRRR